MSDKIRTFIAITIPESLTEHVRKIQNHIKPYEFQTRWVKPENIHITLKFLGDIPVSDIDKIAGGMSEAAETAGPITLSVKGIGAFPGIKRPRIIWAGLSGDTHQLIILQQHMDEKLEKLGFPKENRPFKAHLTIARVKGHIPPEELLDSMEKFGKLESPKFTASEIILYQSVLKPSGAVYTKLKSAALKA